MLGFVKSLMLSVSSRMKISSITGFMGELMTSQYVCAASWASSMLKCKPGKSAKVASVHCVWYTLSFVFVHLLLVTA